MFLALGSSGGINGKALGPWEDTLDLTERVPHREVSRVIDIWGRIEQLHGRSSGGGNWSVSIPVLGLKKYQHPEDFHWSVRPLVIAIGLFTAMKLEAFCRLENGKIDYQKATWKENHGEHQQQVNGGAASNPAWLPPPVANVLFREGVSASAQ
ncbi:hypothetical protein ACJRO7_015509 [Eucalyptus globulus]|uniref:Uncharacterized protein n=1 Tax=Eucalyptus globulus TaxID=34317 RepID=A0ABD3L9R3_EUCGL